MNIFLIRPIRAANDKTLKDAATYRDLLESRGDQVYDPIRDTNQVDDTGLRICRDNLAAIKAADEIHIIYDGTSTGCLFDLGMAFALNKSIVPVQLPEWIEGEKSFAAMIEAYYQSWS